MIAVIDYGMGNLGSVGKALAALGLPYEITDDPKKVLEARGAILPGVGAFADAMRSLAERGLDEAIKTRVERERPLLGICLGMQLLFSHSEENYGVAGFGIIPGRVKRLPPGMKVPHMGWNDIEITKDSFLFEGIDPGSYFYFVHSYYVDPDEKEVTAARTRYSISFTSAIVKDCLAATQFHPEKSGRIGLALLKNFGEMVAR